MVTPVCKSERCSMLSLECSSCLRLVTKQSLIIPAAIMGNGNHTKIRTGGCVCSAVFVGSTVFSTDRQEHFERVIPRRSLKAVDVSSQKY